MAESKVVCERVLEVDSTGCLVIKNHPRRVGIDPRTAEERKAKVPDPRKQIRTDLVIKITGDTASQVFNACGLSYVIVESAKKLGIYDGKTWGELSEQEQLSYDGRTVPIDLNDHPSYLLKTEKGTKNVVREPEFASIASLVKKSKLNAADATDDPAVKEMLTKDAEDWKASYVKGVFLGTIEADADRVKFIKREVEKARKNLDAFANA